jgi:hypothetical protein
MRECDDGASKTALPARRAQLWQPFLNGNDREPVVHSHSFLGVPMRAEKMTRLSADVRKQMPDLDPARFTAGLIGLYEAVLSEPVPQRMLRLIEEIGRQERKS